MGLSQWEFSMRSGINIGTLRNWEQGRNEPQIEIVARLIAALGPRAQPPLERLGVKASQIQISVLPGEQLRPGSKSVAFKETTKRGRADSGKLERRL